jgi:hypothetical protein
VSQDLSSELGADEARALTDEIKGATERLYALLLQAHEGRAWSALGYDSWRDYAMTEFGMSQSRAYQLLDQGRVIQAIEAARSADVASTIVEVDQPPASRSLPNESQARELADLADEPQKLTKVWDAAVAATSGKPTAAAVKEARQQIAPRPILPPRPTSAPRPTLLPPLAPLAPPEPITHVEIVDAEIVEDDAKRDAELEALLAETDQKFRANFSTALGKSGEFRAFDIARIAQVYGNPTERQRLQSWLKEIRDWCDRVSEALDKTTTLRSIGGGR